MDFNAKPLSEQLTEAGVKFEYKHLNDDSQGGRMVYVIDGKQYTPGEAKNYLN